MQKTLILWDIDGTLLESGGAGMAALRLGLCDAFGIAGTLDGIEFAGRTDRWIIRRIFERFGIEPEPLNFSRYVDAYIGRLPSVMRERSARILPGVASILGSAAGRSGVSQGLLTGNLRRGAETKLGFHGLWGHFPVGAFADDSEARNDLGPHALRRAREHWGVDFPLERVWIVGDTPHDIACARAFGARVLAVATGSSSASELSALGPDATMADLSREDAFWEAVGA
jgi:phosphoglycolate phosphatase-like HAD superfamily hydrolase